MIGTPNLSELYCSYEDEYIDAFKRFLHAGDFIGGNSIEHFEDALAKFLNKKYVVSCKSGTHALQLALKASNIGQGDEVISVANTYYATIWAIWSVGARVVFCDVGKDGLIDINKIEKCITAKTKAILPVHLYGIPCEMNGILRLCKKYDLFLIEDASHAFGGSFLKRNDKVLNPEKRFICFSLYPTKNLGVMGDGGIIVTNSEFKATILKDLRYFSSNPLYGQFQKHAMHAQLDTLQAILATENLKYINQWSRHRQSLAKQYAEAFCNHIDYLPDIVGKEVVPYVFPIFHEDRDRLLNYLKEHGVFAQIHYKTDLHKLGWFNGKRNISLPQTEWHNAHVLTLPLFPTLSNENAEFICKTILNF